MSSALTAETPAGKVVIAPEVYRNLQQYRQNGRKHETGGALAGYKVDDDTWVICSLMHPSPKNKSGRTWLERDLAAAQEFANRVHGQSAGQLTYIGEWHTHPEKHPTPSSADTGMLNDILSGSRPKPPFLFGLILGTHGDICLWYQDRKSRVEVYPLSPPKSQIKGEANLEELPIVTETEIVIPPFDTDRRLSRVGELRFTKAKMPISLILLMDWVFGGTQTNGF